MNRPELTDELRIRFLAQYPLCPCIIQEIDTLGNVIETQDKIEGFDFVTGEVIAERVTWRKPTCIIPLLKRAKDHITNIDEMNYINSIGGDSWHIHSYLLSKYYAVPFMGYEIEELVEAGWIKLI